MSRSAVIAAPETVALAELPERAPGPGEVAVTIEGSGICGSDLPVWEGRPWFDYPREPGAPGHEGWGRVAAVGPDVTGVRAGDRVATLGTHAYAGWEVVRADRLIVLPAELDAEPFPGEALGCACNVAARAGFAAGQTVAVVGTGFLGSAVVALAVAAGTEVIAVSRRGGARQRALTLGAAAALTPEDAPAGVQEHTDGRMCDVVVEAAGAQATLDVAGRLARVRGRLVIAGFHQDGPRQVDMQRWNWNGLDVVNAHERDPAVYLAGMRAAVAVVRGGHLPLDRLITHRIDLARVGEGFNLMRERPEDFLKAVVLVS